MALRSYLAAHRFDPRSIPGLEGWWDAADAASVTLDSGRVSEWRDKSGLGRHAANSTSGSTQPDYVEAGRNGINVLRFAAASTQRLTIASSTAAFNFFHNGTESYFLAVSKYGTTADPNAVFVAFGNGGATSAQIGATYFFDDRAGSSRNNALAAWIGNGSGTFSSSTVVQNAVTPQSFHVQECLWDADNATLANRSRISVDGGAYQGSNAASGTHSLSNATNNMQFGAAGNNSFPLQGDICELLIFSELPTSLARDALRRYIAAKWGVTLA